MKLKNIKTVIILFLLFSMQQKIGAQIPAVGSYLTNNTMGAFHGTWQWVDGTDTVKIFLATKKVYYPISGGFYMDNLVGWHMYKNGNTIIESSYPNINNIGLSTFLGGNDNIPNDSKCFGTLKDIIKNKEGALKLNLNTAQNQLTWKLEVSPGMHVRTPGDPPYYPGFTLPQNMILIKQ